MANPIIIGVIVLWHASDQAIGLFESGAVLLLCQIELATLSCRVGFEPTSLRGQRMYPHEVRTMRPGGSVPSTETKALFIQTMTMANRYTRNPVGPETGVSWPG